MSLFSSSFINRALGMILFRHVVCAVCLSIGCLIPRMGLAESSPLKSATLTRVGFDGRFKVGQWTPLTVVVETTAACRLELSLETSDPDGNRAVWTDKFEVPAAGTHPLSMLFQPGRLDTTLRPRVAVKNPEGEETFSLPVVPGDGPAAQFRQQALMQSVLLVATLGKPGGLIEEQVSSNDPNEPVSQASQIPIHVVEMDDPSELTITDRNGQDAAFRNATGLEAIDTLVISGQYEMSPVQSEALKAWLTLGGHLIVAVGGELPSYQNSPLAKWLTDEAAGQNQVCQLGGATTYRVLDTLEHFAGKNAVAIAINPQSPVQGVKIAINKGEESLLSTQTGPLIVRGPYGFGTVTFIGLSLSEEPIQSWPSLPRAMQKLLRDAKAESSARAKSINKQLAHSGITEFATQVHSALQAFRPVNRLSTWAVIGFLAVYLLVIGPLDYFLVHQIFKRPRLTWLTFPILVAIAAIIGVNLSRSHNGQSLLTSQLNVLDYDASTNLLRSRTWMSLYSPESRRYHLSLEPESIENSSSGEEQRAAVRMSWFGTPETTFGGMYREGGQSISPPMYQFSNEAQTIENLPVPIWGAKALTGEWCAQGEVLVESHLESPRPGQIRGTIRHHFPVPITDWFLAYETRVFLPRTNLATSEVDPFPPGSDWPRNDPNWDRVRLREINGYLTKTVARQFQKTQPGSDNADSIRLEQVPYDPLAEGNADPLGEILRILTFHQMVGGKQYTGMENHAFRDMDLSGRLGLNRAVLYGRLDWNPAQLQIEGHELTDNKPETFIRIVLPVEIKHAEVLPPLNFGIESSSTPRQD